MLRFMAIFIANYKYMLSEATCFVVYGIAIFTLYWTYHVIQYAFNLLFTMVSLTDNNSHTFLSLVAIRSSGKGANKTGCHQDFF